LKKLLYLLILIFCTNALFAFDCNDDGVQHPHGIVSNKIDTVVEQDNSNYVITGGVIKGTNLFHMFKKFNIHSNEKAWFPHQPGVQNIIGNISGGEYSWINGEIICVSFNGTNLSASNSNLYLINPAGFMFGKNVSLNLEGSFHATTADYIVPERKRIIFKKDYFLSSRKNIFH